MWLTVTFCILLAVLLVAFVLQWQRGRNPQPLGPGQASNFVQGTLTLTGISDRPEGADKNGDRFCTVSGTIVGPETTPTEVYGTLVLGDGDPWPTIGSDHAVVYKPGKAATSWRFGVLPPAADGFSSF